MIECQIGKNIRSLRCKWQINQEVILVTHRLGQSAERIKSLYWIMAVSLNRELLNS